MMMTVAAPSSMANPRDGVTLDSLTPIARMILYLNVGGAGHRLSSTAGAIASAVPNLVLVLVLMILYLNVGEVGGSVLFTVTLAW